MEGLEPSSLVRTADFESAAVASFATSPCGPDLHKLRRKGRRVKKLLRMSFRQLRKRMSPQWTIPPRHCATVRQSCAKSRHSAYDLRRGVFSAVLMSLCLMCSFASAQLSPYSLPLDRISLHISDARPDSVYLLTHMFVAEGTDTVSLDGRTVLHRNIDYRVFPRHGSMRFLGPFWDSLRAKQQREAVVDVRFRYFPFTFRDVYAKREVVALRDSLDTLRVARPVAAVTLDDIFGPDLQKSGSIFRGLTVGTNRDLTLNSGLRMTLSGHIAKDIEVTAALTDENTPIQPEGTTQTLQEFDKVFVEIRGGNLAATLGDFVLDVKGTEFSRLSRKVQGAKGEGSYQFGFAEGSAFAVGAVNRGKFNTMQFNGIEGVQGPYLLTGRNNERAIIVVAGTERVYINGEQMVRGETNDFIIDYSTGELTFTPRRLVTSASRMTIDFEYSDRQYSRSLVAAETHTAFFTNKAALTLTFLREADDPDAPIDLVLSDSVRRIIAGAGGDRNKAVMSGVVPADSNGQYVRVDTLLAGGIPATFYRYAPGDPAAKYNVTFSRIGPGAGQYVRLQVGVFEWRGDGAGDYVPLRYLPLPSSQQMMDAALDLEPLKELHVRGEFAATDANPNRLSLQNVSSQGHGVNVSAQWASSSISLGAFTLGRFDVQLRERYTSSAFAPLDRTNDIEVNRKWGIDSLRQTSEEIREGALHYMPDSSITVGFGIGRNARGAQFESQRDEGTLAIRGPVLPAVDYIVESVRSRDGGNSTSSDWFRQRGRAEHAFGVIVPHVRYESERRVYEGSDGGMQLNSFGLQDGGIGFDIKRVGPLSFSTEYGWRRQDAVFRGVLEKQATAFTQTYGARLNDGGNLSSQLDVTLRDKRYTADFRSLGNSDVRSVLLRNQTRYSLLNRGIETDAVYEVSTERSSKLERVFVRVAIGSGNYKYLGDLNTNGIADDAEFVPARFDGDYVAVTVPTDQLFPVIDLKTGLRVRITPSRFLAQDASWSKLLSMLSSETYVRIEEKTTQSDLKQIYLLHLGRFLSDSTTLSGSQLFTQDLLVLDGNPVFSGRLRFSDRRGLSNFSGGLERSYTRERSLRLRWQLIPEVSNQIDYVSRTDALGSPQNPSRSRFISGDDVTLDIAYRPEIDLEVGWKVEVARAIDSAPEIPVQGDLNVESVRAVYAFRGAGQVRVELGREEMGLSRVPDVFPYELTGGRVAGKTWTWHAGVEYRIMQFLQATVAYDGRTEGGNAPVHTGRAEVRAFF